MKKLTLIFLVITLILIVAACSSVNSEEIAEDLTNNDNENTNIENTKDTGDVEEITENEVAEPPQNITGLQPNEKGQVMILMYHQIGDKESTWVRTRENFRRDLQTLYEKGYRLISLKDYLDNKINLPLGTTPVILTFDDSYNNQFDIIEKNGEFEVDPESAAGIMLDFSKEHPDFGLEATFYINQNPFNYKNWQEALKKIVDLGMDIGNHTLSHKNLGKLSSEKYPAEIGGLAAKVKEVLPEYTMDTLALPYGSYPHDLEKTVEGEFGGVKYKNRALLLVGANPAPAPTDPKFNPLKLPRVRGDEENLYRWLDYFDKNPEKRYVSAGINN